MVTIGSSRRRSFSRTGSARYAAIGTRAVRTDAAGATQWRMRADGSIQVDSMRAQHARYWFNRPGIALPDVPADDLSSLPVEAPMAVRAEPQIEPLPPH
jgi:hypothetical protein